MQDITFSNLVKKSDFPQLKLEGGDNHPVDFPTLKVEEPIIEETVIAETPVESKIEVKKEVKKVVVPEVKTIEE